jgi:integrase
MATFVQAPDGKWKAIIRRKGWPIVAKTFRTKRDAQDWARQAEDEMVRGIFINRADSHGKSIDDALSTYLREITPTKKPSTQYREKGRIKTLREKLKKYSLAAVTPKIVAEYRDERLAEGMSHSSVRLELALLSHLYTIAIKEWRLGLVMNPVSMIWKPKPHEGRSRRLQGDEQTRILKECDAHSNPMLGWMVRVALHTGMRLGEIRSLRVSQVDLRKRVVQLTDTKNGSPRTIPLTKEAVAVLKLAVERPGLGLRPKNTDLVFFGEPNEKGEIRGYRIEKAWADVKKDAGVPDFRFHDLRHESVSRLVELGLSDQEVASISGHRSMQMLKRYTHLRAEDLVSKLDELQKLPAPKKKPRRETGTSAGRATRKRPLKSRDRIAMPPSAPTSDEHRMPAPSAE